MPESALSIDGELRPLDGPHLDARDRGFLLGDGLFETIRVRGGVLVRWARHLARLHTGASTIGLALVWSDDDLAEVVRRTLAAGDLVDAVVRLSLSRGVSHTRGLLPDPAASPTLVVHAAPFAGYPPDRYERGTRAITSSLRRNEHSPLARIKSLNYLDNVLARREAADRGADEALLVNTAGLLAGASAANLFLVVGGQIVTPPIAAGALPGTVRAAVLDATTVVERPVTPTDLVNASEAFLTNALLGIVPLTIVDDRPVGGGTPGAIARALAATALP